MFFVIIAENNKVVFYSNSIIYTRCMRPMTYEEKKNLISQALFDRKGLESIVNTASLVFGNPIFINDKSFKLLCKSSVSEEDENTWRILFPDNRMSIEASNKVEKDGVYKHILSSDEPIYGLFDFYEHPFLGCRIRDKEGMVAMATMVMNHPISKEDEKLYKFFCQVVFYELLYTNQTGMQKVPYFNLLNDLLHHSIPKEELEQRIALLHLSIPKRMRIIVFEYENTPGLSLYYLLDSISSVFSWCLTILYEERIVLIIDEESLKEEILTSILNGYSLRLSISKTCSDLYDLPKFYQQAILALRISKKKISFYEDVVFLDLLSSAPIEKCKECIHSSLFILKEYDARHSVCLFETLEVFLENNQNIQKASDQLHIHRSSLYSRLEKIKQLTHIDLEKSDSIFHLMVSFRIYHFLY